MRLLFRGTHRCGTMRGSRKPRLRGACGWGRVGVLAPARPVEVNYANVLEEAIAYGYRDTWYNLPRRGVRKCPRALQSRQT